MNKNVLEAKKSTVKEISDGFKSSSLMAVVSYQGLTVSELTELRHDLAKKGATFGVYKNTLVGRALKDNNVSGLESYLQGANAFVFSKDVTSAPAVLYKFSRYHEKLVLKAAYAENTVIDAAGLKELARIPGKEGLLSMFCMVLNEPAASFARAVKSIADKKPAAAATASAAN